MGWTSVYEGRAVAGALRMNASLLLDVQHDTHYRYASPVSLAHHLAHLQPLQDAHQAVLAFDLNIDPAPDRSALGLLAPVAAQPGAAPVSPHPAQRCFSLAQPHRHLRVRAHSRLRVWPRFEALQPESSPPWDTLARSLRFRPGAPFEAAAEYAYPSPYVPRLAALRAYALPSFAPGRPVVQAALHLMQRVHADFSYEAHSTHIDTPLAQVLQHRRGVCQDFAHLMIGALRMLGLPARYVSGYLLTQPPEGGPALLGADATHAWLQLWCPGTPGVPTLESSAPGVPAQEAGAGWLDLDPTNNRVPGAGHVRLAVGRDFGDVTPLRGVIRGGGLHTLTVGVSTHVVADEAA